MTATCEGCGRGPARCIGTDPRCVTRNVTPIPSSANGGGAAPKRGTDISGQPLAAVHEGYLRWLGSDYDLGALDCVLATAAAEQLDGDPPWLLVVGGSGATKTETLMPLTGAGAHVISTISGEAGLLSGTPAKERAADATGGLLARIGGRGLLVVKDFTSILSMNRDTRALVLAALREIYDGSWSRDIGAEGGRTLNWHGRLVVIGACTTAWDRAHQVVGVMGDRFVLVRLASGESRRQAGLQAMRNVAHERAMRSELAALTGELLTNLGSPPEPAGDDLAYLLGLADLVTRARTPVERDSQARPEWAHALEMPTRYAKQLVQIVRGAMALGIDRPAALAIAARCAADSIPPLRLRVLADVTAHPDSRTAEVVKRLQLPRMTVDRTLQELHLLGLLVVDEIDAGQRYPTWIYSLAEETDRADLATLTRFVTPPLRARARLALASGLPPTGTGAP